jgi:hypothetical protein
MTKSDKVLVFLLRLVGVGSLFSLVAVVMPSTWMAATHRWLGLGEMPTGPVVEYLARDLSAFYALVGALVAIKDDLLSVSGDLVTLPQNPGYAFGEGPGGHRCTPWRDAPAPRSPRSTHGGAEGRPTGS